MVYYLFSIEGVFILKKKDIGTVGGVSITKSVLTCYEATFEKDWIHPEINVLPTDRGEAMHALREINIPSIEVEGLKDSET